MQHPNPENITLSDILSTEGLSHAFISNLPGAAVFVVDRDLRYLLAEGEALAIAGFKPEDFVGRTIFEVLPPELAASYEPMYRKVWAGELFEDEHHAHDRWYISRGTPLRADGGEIRAVLVVSYDITERKRVEDECKRREANLAFLAELAEDFSCLSSAAEIMRAVGTKVGTYLNISTCLFAEINEGQDQTIVQYPWHTPDTPDLTGVYRLSDFLTEEFRQAARSGETIVIRDTQADPRTNGNQYAALKIHAFVSVPFHREGEWKYMFSVTDSVARDWREDEIELIREMTNRAFLRLERAHVEEALRESEEKYRSLFESIDEGFNLLEMISDESGHPCDFRIVETNLAWEQQTGLTDAIGKTLLEISPNFEQQWLDFYSNVAISGRGGRTEYYNADVDRWYTVYASRIGGEGSRQLAVVFNDISDRKRREVILRENEARQAFLLKLSDILQQFVQPNDIKAAAMRLLGEHLGVSRAQYHECDSSGEYYSADGVGYANGLPLLDLKYRIDDFGTFVNEDFAAGRPYRSDDLEVDPRVSAEERDAYRTYQIRAGAGMPLIRGGKLVAILAIHDVHPHPWTDLEMDLIRETAERIWTPLERVRAEAALRESEAKYRSLFESINDGFALLEVLYDADDRPIDCRFLEVNPSFEAQTTLPQAQGKTLRELIPSVEPDWFEYYHQALVTNAPVHFEMYQSYIKIWFEVDVLPYGNPQDRQVVIVLQNINERKQAEAERLQLIREQSAREQERQRAETLAELDRAKTAFFSNVSHEFRTPLTLSLAPLQDALTSVDEWMDGWADENLSTHPSIHPSTLKHNLELVHRNSRRLLKLVNTLLDFSRMEAGRMEAVYEPTDLATYTAELASVFRSAIERAGLQLIVDCPLLPKPVFVDREMWEKVVLNLLSNAFKFTFKGEIRVSLCSTDSNQAILQIQDTGTGIAPEHLPHLFERFYQVRGTQARTHEGSGIGLALVHELVRLQGGTIEVSSTVGEGTCFTIALPFGTEHLPGDRLHLEGDRTQPVRTLASTAMGATAFAEEAERWLTTEMSEVSKTSEISPPNLASTRVLVIDDNADMREYLTRILSEHVQVEAVADGVTALAVAQEQVPDLILSDVMMPGLDGFELLEALRSDSRTREIPIILLSARAGEEAIVEGLEAGADDYLIKPFSAQELISRITAHLQTAQQRSAALQEARSTLRSRDEFISVVSHELNTPLVSILGWTRMLRSSPPNPLILSKALDTIERNATLQAKLVQDLLDLSRISAGKFRLHPQPVELKPLIESAIATVTQSAADKSINLTWQEIISEPVVMMGDGDRLQQVICNLLTNAIKFTPEGGRVEISLSFVTGHSSLIEEQITNDKGLMTNNHYAEIRVTDTGIGIAADFLPHVFERFRQAQGANAAKGLGLGLAIARHIVELHNGTIHADSAGEGQGATFAVRLPLLQKRDDFSKIQSGI